MLLRAWIMAGLWQRTALAVSGGVGIVALLDVRAAAVGPLSRAMILVALLALAALLLVLAARPRPARMLPMWGHAAEILETCTALALVPLTLQLLHAYAYFRNLTG